MSKRNGNRIMSIQEAMGAGKVPKFMTRDDMVGLYGPLASMLRDIARRVDVIEQKLGIAPPDQEEQQSNSGDVE